MRTLKWAKYVVWVPVGHQLRGRVALKLHFFALEIVKSINLIEQKALEMQGDECSPWISEVKFQCRPVPETWSGPQERFAPRRGNSLAVCGLQQRLSVSAERGCSLKIPCKTVCQSASCVTRYREPRSAPNWLEQAQTSQNAALSRTLCGIWGFGPCAEMQMLSSATGALELVFIAPVIYKQYWCRHLQLMHFYFFLPTQAFCVFKLSFFSSPAMAQKLLPMCQVWKKPRIYNPNWKRGRNLL